MSAATENFAAWACDPKRSLEERFGAELLIEDLLGHWRHKHGVKRNANYEAESLRKKERSLNPAYQPVFSPEDAARAAEVLPDVKSLDFNLYNDRPLRDLSFLRFCPPLESLSFHSVEIRDWSPLATQPALAKLYISDDATRDLSVLGRLTRLRHLSLSLDAPWPELGRLEDLAELQDFQLRGNILLLQGIPRLPQVREVKLTHGYGNRIPLRRVADLPAMPELRRLHLEDTDELEGIGKFARLLNLEIHGYYTTLEPLAELKNLTHLKLCGGSYPNIAPLARMPQLRDLVIHHEEPPDFTPLADSPSLHEIRLERSPVVPAELGAINALLAPWSGEFAAAEPRPLAPLKLLLFDKQDHTDTDSDGSPRDWGDDHGMGASESRWFRRAVNRRLTALLGKGWGEEESPFDHSPGNVHITICRPPDLDRIPEIVQCLRQMLAAARYPWGFLFIVDSSRFYERDVADIYKAEGEKFDPDREREEWEDQQERERERREFLERKYRLRLQQELGAPVKPEEFAPSPPPPREEDDTVTAGGLDEPEAPEYDLGTDISLYSTLTEKAVYVHESDRGLAELLLEIKADP